MIEWLVDNDPIGIFLFVIFLSLLLGFFIEFFPRWFEPNKEEWCDKGGIHYYKIIDYKIGYFKDSGFTFDYRYCEKKECVKCGKIKNPCGL